MKGLESRIMYSVKKGKKEEQLKVAVFDTIRKQMLKKDEWTKNGSTQSVYEEAVFHLGRLRVWLPDSGGQKVKVFPIY